MRRGNGIENQMTLPATRRSAASDWAASSNRLSFSDVRAGLTSATLCFGCQVLIGRVDLESVPDIEKCQEKARDLVPVLHNIDRRTGRTFRLLGLVGGAWLGGSKMGRCRWC